MKKITCRDKAYSLWEWVQLEAANTKEDQEKFLQRIAAICYAEKKEVWRVSIKDRVKKLLRLGKVQDVEKTSVQLIEKLADLEHKQWAHWTKYMLNTLELVSAKDRKMCIENWRAQIYTPYTQLTDKEKEADIIKAFEELFKRTE